MFKLERGYYKGLYFVSALYDLVLGFMFLFFYEKILDFVDMPIPDNPAYLAASSMFIFIFGILLFMIYLKPEGSRRMVIYSILFKFGYISVAVYYLITRGTDFVKWPFLTFIVCDIIFAAFFIESLRFIKE